MAMHSWPVSEEKRYIELGPPCSFLFSQSVHVQRHRLPLKDRAASQRKISCLRRRKNNEES
jgi:hypothetical protein